MTIRSVFRTVMAVLALVAGQAAAAAAQAQTDAPAEADPAPLSGVYEAVFGVNDLVGEIGYWERFGYEVDRTGRLTADQASALYGVDQAVSVVRLRHRGGADHGLVRLMAWETPTGPGLGTAKLLVPGSRWISALTRDALKIWNHAELAAAAGTPSRIVAPQWSQIYALGQGRPYRDPALGVREMVVLDPLRRRVFFERFNYDVPHFGTVDDTSFFQTSQITHQGIVFAGDDPALTRFYETTLGLLPNGEESLKTYEGFSAATRAVYAMEPGEKYYGATFDNPTTDGQTLDTVKSGRLLVRRIPTDLVEDNAQAAAGPGVLGLSLFTYRAEDVAAWHGHIADSPAQAVTPVVRNALGEAAFTFTAPDGTIWGIVGPLADEASR